MRRGVLKQLSALTSSISPRSTRPNIIEPTLPGALASFGQLLSRWSGLTSERYFSTETEPTENNKEKEQSESSSTERLEDIETELPETEDTEVTEEPVAEEVSERIRTILDEKDAALRYLAEQAEEEKKQRLLALADAENLRTRFARESAQIKKFAVQGFIQSLLGCLDNLDRAIDSTPAEFRDMKDVADTDPTKLLNALNTLLTGVSMTQTEFRHVLQSHGVERYDPIGKTFDPNEHMARFELKDATKEPGTVGIVTLCGYKMHERVIRPAEVGVIRKSDEEEETAQTNEKSETGS